MNNKKQYLISKAMATIIIIIGIVTFTVNKKDDIKLNKNVSLLNNSEKEKHAATKPKTDISLPIADFKQTQSFTLPINNGKQQQYQQKNTEKSIQVDNLAKKQRVKDNANVEVNRYLDIQLWNVNKFAKNAYDAYDKNNRLSAEHFIDFDENALQEIEVGDSFNLPLNKDSKFDVIVTDVTQLQNNATNIGLVDASGNQRGSLTQIGQRVEGFFIANDNQEYFLRAIGGVGWIASKESLIKNTESKILLKDDKTK